VCNEGKGRQITDLIRRESKRVFDRAADNAADKTGIAVNITPI